MNIKISEHAAKRMAERNISEKVVRESFDAEDWESYDVSEVDETAVIVTKTINGKNGVSFLTGKQQLLSPAIRGGKTCTKDLLKKKLKSPNTTRI